MGSEMCIRDSLYGMDTGLNESYLQNVCGLRYNSASFDFLYLPKTYIKGRNHVHLTVRVGFITQHLWFGDFGNVTEVFVHEVFGYVTSYPKSSVTSPSAN